MCVKSKLDPHTTTTTTTKKKCQKWKWNFYLGIVFVFLFLFARTAIILVVRFTMMIRSAGHFTVTSLVPFAWTLHHRLGFPGPVITFILSSQFQSFNINIKSSCSLIHFFFLIIVVVSFTFSCTTEDEEEQLLVELGDFLWLRRSPSGSGLLLPLSCFDRFRAFCSDKVKKEKKMN